jgi:succinate-semialdehyde dehydrogenase / glutarate-semialdehyde dehydrogenase
MIKTISPVDGKVVVERNTSTEEEITAILQKADTAFKAHRRTPLSTRIGIAHKFLGLLDADKDKLVCLQPTKLIQGRRADDDDGKAYQVYPQGD